MTVESGETKFILKMKTENEKRLISCRWLEYWQRKQRQYVCRAQSWSDEVFNVAYRSRGVSKNFCNLDDGGRLENELRDVTCTNKNSQLLIEVRRRQSVCTNENLWAPYLFDSIRYLNRNWNADGIAHRN